MRQGLVAFVLVFGLGGASATTVEPAPGPDGWESLSSAAKTFTVEDLQGRTLRSEDLAGRIVIIDFWATWCSPCIRELPGLVEYHRRLEGRQDVVLLSFNVTDERADLEAFVAERERSPFASISVTISSARTRSWRFPPSWSSTCARPAPTTPG